MAEVTSDMVEVPSEHDSGCDLDDSLYLHFNYSIYKKRNFWKAIWVKERAKWVDLSSIKEKQNRQEKKRILSRPSIYVLVY